MSATITMNWLESFKTNLGCGPFPSKTSNPYIETLTGLVGVFIEYVLSLDSTILDVEAASGNLEDTNNNALAMWYKKIQCGEFFESDAQAWMVFAMAMNKLRENSVAAETEEAAESLALSRAVTDPAANTYTAVAEDFDAPTKETTLLVTDADPVTVVLPLEATIPVSVGYKVKVIQLGAGAVTADAEGAATIQGTMVTTGVNDVLFIEKIATNVWHSALLVA
jgi:hypothetical protein